MSPPAAVAPSTPTSDQACTGGRWSAMLRSTVAGTGFRRWASVAGSAMSASVLILAGLVASSSAAYAAVLPVGLGTAATYSVLGATGISNTGNTVLNGDLGVSPINSIIGFGPGVVHG